ncbi:hypothetical protein DXT99_26090 [Pontibacter diazotrophicus]|uniref:Uncharacterized protein n=1 Tax=Pontibacter diazotrophicus TaxID=1400979 RepID=A0A3D8L0G6_9BACT|nr:hypothetical protein DXT99_26090 [Pontibacter diazotrophicus]
MKTLTYFTLVFEIAFPMLIWFNRFKLPLMACGVLLHIGIFLLMRIDGFSIPMLLCYIALVPDSDIIRIRTYFTRKVNFVGITRTSL